LKMAPDLTGVAAAACGLAVIGCFTIESGVIEQADTIIVMMNKQLLNVLFSIVLLNQF
jgi:hypothetical protein